jgi:hypothetical protein
MITKEQDEQITPLLQQVVDVLNINFGEIRVVVNNGCVHRIIPSDDILKSKRDIK